MVAVHVNAAQGHMHLPVNYFKNLIKASGPHGGWVEQVKPACDTTFDDITPM